VQLGASTIAVIRMNTSIRIALCHYHDLLGRHQLNAELDELTLTYRVVANDPDGRSRTIRRHLLSLFETRRWAIAYCAASADEGSA
jgi:hypothetical protein